MGFTPCFGPSVPWGPSLGHDLVRGEGGYPGGGWVTRHRRTLMRPPVVTRQTRPLRGDVAFFPLWLVLALVVSGVVV
jgi:hypothetical protein